MHGITLTGNTAEYGGGVYSESDMTLGGGLFSGNTAVYGGGLYNDDVANVYGSTVQENQASTEGGGIFNDTAATLNLGASRVVYNNAPSGGGGGIFNRGTVHLFGTLVRYNTLNNCSPVASVPGCFG
jgi:predicted outer membrane repeat protein